jgi:hypothetical protein
MSLFAEHERSTVLLLMLMLMLIVYDVESSSLVLRAFDTQPSTMNNESSFNDDDHNNNNRNNNPNTIQSTSSSSSVSSIELLNRGFLNAFLWAKGSVGAALFLLVSNWCAVHFLVLHVWHFDASTRTSDSELCLIDALMSMLGVAVETRTVVEHAVFWSFHALEAFLAYLLIWCIFSDPGVLRPPLVKHSHHDNTCELCGAARLPVLRPHHCRKCRHCVERLDHCCAWIGQDVGARNHKTFFVYVAISLLLLIFDSVVLWTRLAEIAIAVVGFQSFVITATQALHALLIVVLASLYSGCAYSVLTLFFIQCELIYRDETTYEWLQRLRSERERDIVSAAPPNNWRNVRRFFGETWLELLNLHRAVPPRL